LRRIGDASASQAYGVAGALNRLNAAFEMLCAHVGIPENARHSRELVAIKRPRQVGSAGAAGVLGSFASL